MGKGDIMNRAFIFRAACVGLLTTSGFAQTIKTTLSLQVGGKQRSCAIYVPTGISKPAVVFFIHGANGSGGNFENDTKGDVTADKNKFIALYPSADAKGGTGTWDDMTGTGNFPFFQALLDTMDARYKIDRTRIYMTGFSQGGFISFAAACFYSDIFAAVAPVSGHLIATCTIKRPVPMFMTFGAQEVAASFLQDRDVWLKLNKCPATETLTKPYPASSANSKAVRAAYGPCDQNSSVLVDSIIGQGHQWPDPTNLVQADEVWSFFKQYSLGSATGVSPTGPRQDAPFHAKISVAYTAGRVRLQGVDEGVRVRVTDTQGKLVADATVSHGAISFRDQPRGVYILSTGESRNSVDQKFLVP